MGTADGYRSEKLKRRLQNYFGDALVFHKQNDPSKPELIHSSHISLKEVINAASKSFNTLVPTSAIPSTTDRDLEKTRTLYHAAQIIKADIKTCQGIEIQPLATEELTLNRAKTLIPNSLMKLLSWVITKQSSDYVDVTAGLSEADERHVLMIGQDILHSATHGRIKTPKHVGLAMSVRHLTGSKQLITMLNRMGHCSSYDEVEAVDTSLAMEVLAKSETTGVVIPSNIVPGGFIQAAADNNDINEETLDGKQTTHATTIVLFQRGQFGPLPRPVKLASHSVRKRALSGTSVLQPVSECSAYGKRPSVSSFINKVDKGWFECHGRPDSEAQQKDMAWCILRQRSTTLFQVDLALRDSAPYLVPGWSGFNAIVSSSAPPLTNIGYCPMVASPSTEYSTIYTVMKNVHKMTTSLGQSKSVITFDLAIYLKAKEIQVRLEAILHQCFSKENLTIEEYELIRWLQRQCNGCSGRGSAHG